MIRPVTLADAQAINSIYNYYIENTAITFEEETLDSSEMKKRILEYTEDYPWLVYEENGGIVAYCYAAKWRTRSAYRYSVETSVYVDKDLQGKGIGFALYTALLNELKKKRVHAVIAGITLPNERSQKLHEKLGFIKIAQFEEVGFKFQSWFDVGYWELQI